MNYTCNRYEVADGHDFRGGSNQLVVGQRDSDSYGFDTVKGNPKSVELA